MKVVIKSLKMIVKASKVMSLNLGLFEVFKIEENDHHFSFGSEAWRRVLRGDLSTNRNFRRFINKEAMLQRSGSYLNCCLYHCSL